MTEEKKTSTKSMNKQTRMTAMVLVAIALLGVGFVGGMQYQKDQKTAPASGSTANGTTNGATRGRFGGRFAGTFGTVTEVSSTSISIKNQRTGDTQSFTIDSATTVTDSGTTSSISAIKTGDSAIIRTDTSDTTKASVIAINPQAPTGAGFGPGSSTAAPAN